MLKFNVIQIICLLTRKKFIYTSLAVILANTLFCQNIWEVKYGLSWKKEVFRDFIETYDKGYFIGNSELNDRYSWEIKTSNNGDILWEKTIGNIDSIFTVTAVIENFDQGVVLVGNYSESSGQHGEMIIRLDNCGNKLWCCYFETSNYTSGSFSDVLILQDSNILVLGRLGTEEKIEQVFLFCYNQDGELLWLKPYATKYDHPEIGFATGRDLYQFQDYFLISGYCYWPYPTNPNIYYQRPMIIKVDAGFNEEWLLPYGVADSINGASWGLLALSDTTYMAHGKCYVGNDTRALIMQFDEQGNETSYSIVPNEAITPPTRFNGIKGAIQITDTTFIAVANFGPEDVGNPNGEYIFDLAGNIYKFNSRANSSGTARMLKTSDDNFLFGMTYRVNDNYDVYLYKLNANLDPVYFDTTQHNYDTLCPDTIQSGYISLEDCNIITGIEDIPSPKEYYTKLKTIPIIAYPNPAKDKITFAFENTQYHKDISFQCYDIFGRLVYEQKVYSQQVETDVGCWSKGMYVAVVRSNGKVVGKCKFVVE